VAYHWQSNAATPTLSPSIKACCSSLLLLFGITFISVYTAATALCPSCQTLVPAQEHGETVTHLLICPAAALVWDIHNETLDLWFETQLTDQAIRKTDNRFPALMAQCLPNGSLLPQWLCM
jgi:hypothetical protein